MSVLLFLEVRCSELMMAHTSVLQARERKSLRHCYSMVMAFQNSTRSRVRESDVFIKLRKPFLNLRLPMYGERNGSYAIHYL